MRPLSPLAGVASLVALAKNPRNTRAVFGIVDSLRHLGGGEHERRVIAHLRSFPENAAIIDERFTSSSPDLRALARLPAGSLGHVFATHMLARGLDPDFYPVRAVRDDASYVSMRMRRTHDLWHVVTGFDTDLAGELGLQAFCLAQLRTPLATLILMVGLVRTLWAPAELDASMTQIARGYAMGAAARPLFAQRWELDFHRPLATLREELGLGPFFGASEHA